MTQTAEPDSEPARAGRGKGILFGLAGGIALGIGAFAGIFFGVVDPGGPFGDRAPEKPAEAVGFVPLEPMIINLPRGARGRHLRFVGQLEVVPDQAADVNALMPRILDALNTYLRAVEPADLEQPAATIWLRAQMLRRIQVVTGEGLVRDLLITEFVLN